MDLNEFIYRDDTAEVLGGDAIDSDDFAAAEDAARYVTPKKIGPAAIGGAILGGHANQF